MLKCKVYQSVFCLEKIGLVMCVLGCCPGIFVLRKVLWCGLEGIDCHYLYIIIVPSIVFCSGFEKLLSRHLSSISPCMKQKHQKGSPSPCRFSVGGFHVGDEYGLTREGDDGS